MKKRDIIFFGFSGLLFAGAALAWFSYVAQGIAYGDLVGVRGRERDLAEIGKHSIWALGTAGCVEASAVLILWWRLSDPTATAGTRVVIGVALALVAVGCTYLLVRGL